jgi:hypothetical protein
MQIPVLIEPAGENGFRASTQWPFAVTAEGPTRDDALRRLNEQIEARMVPGAEIVWMDASTVEHPLAKFAGRLKDDPLFDEWIEAMAEYRRSVDEDPDAW